MAPTLAGGPAENKRAATAAAASLAAKERAPVAPAVFCPACPVCASAMSSSAPATRTVAFDIGVTNMSYCRVDHSGSDWRITGWARESVKEDGDDTGDMLDRVHALVVRSGVRAGDRVVVELQPAAPVLPYTRAVVFGLSFAVYSSALALGAVPRLSSGKLKSRSDLLEALGISAEDVGGLPVVGYSAQKRFSRLFAVALAGKHADRIDPGAAGRMRADDKKDDWGDSALHALRPVVLER